MSQSEWLGAVLIAGFLVWLAMNNRLSVYWSILTGGAAAATAPPSSGLAIPSQPGANMPMPAPGKTQPSTPFSFPSLKGTPFCILGGTLCN